MKPSPALEIARHARALLLGLNPGETIAIALPDSHFAWTESMRRIGNVAYDIFGRGNYSVDRKDNPAVARITYQPGIRRQHDTDR
jgi:hypothetical protein